MAVGDKYRALHQRSLRDPEGFWAEQAAAIDWTRRWDKVLDASTPPFYRWFAGAELNTCYNALDRHVERGRAEQTALIYDSPVTNGRKSFTYRALRDQVATLAGAIEPVAAAAGAHDPGTLSLDMAEMTNSYALGAAILASYDAQRLRERMAPLYELIRGAINKAAAQDEGA